MYTGEIDYGTQVSSAQRDIVLSGQVNSALKRFVVREAAPTT